MTSKGLQSPLRSEQSHRSPCHLICPVNWPSKPCFCFVFEIINRCLCLDCGSSLNTGFPISPLPSLLFKGRGGPPGAASSIWLPPPQRASGREGPGDPGEWLLRSGALREPLCAALGPRPPAGVFAVPERGGRSAEAGAPRPERCRNSFTQDICKAAGLGPEWRQPHTAWALLLMKSSGRACFWWEPRARTGKRPGKQDGSCSTETARGQAPYQWGWR